MSAHQHAWLKSLPKGQVKNLAAREMIATPKKDSNRVFVLEKGRARICLFGAKRQQTLGYLQENSVFVTHTSTWVEAMEDCRIRSWPIQAIKALFTAEPDMAIGAMREVGKLLQGAIHLIEDLAFRSIESRLARYLLTEHKQQKNVTIKLVGNVELVASLLGTSRQTLSTILNQLIKNGTISRPDRKHIELRDLQHLSELATNLSAS